MVRFINRLTGSLMWVADDRADEYVRAGHLPFEAVRLEDLSDAACETTRKAAQKKRSAKKE